MRRADHSSRGVIPTVMRRRVWSRNLKNEEDTARFGPQRHRKRKKDMAVNTAWLRLVSTKFLCANKTFALNISSSVGRLNRLNLRV